VGRREFRQQHSGGKNGKVLDAVEVRAERARGNGVVIERGVARFGLSKRRKPIAFTGAIVSR